MISVFEFGSRVRGDTDLLSDRDILLLYDNSEDPNSCCASLEALGYSVTAHTVDYAIQSSASGSLFYKHILLEGRVITDESKLLAIIDSTWRPKKSYSEQITGSLELLQIVPELPSSPFGHLVANDLLITSLRNILINSMAEDGNYVYSWRLMLESAAKMDLINREDIPLFLTSRQYKALYRNGLPAFINSSTAQNLFAAFNRAFGCSLKPQARSRRRALSLPGHFRNGSYIQLRALESVCAHYSFAPSVRHIRAMVQRPSAFRTFSINYA